MFRHMIISFALVLVLAPKLSNSADPLFGPPSNYGTGDAPIWVSVADVDGDGDIDVMTPNWNSGNVSILLNDGTGSFAAPVNYSVGNQPSFVLPMDFDGDGDNDLAVSNFDSDSISILFNDGSGIFSTATNYTVGDGPHSIFSADFDNDGDNDLAVVSLFSSNVTILINQGTGIFLTGATYPVGLNPTWVIAHDFNGDLILDLAVVNRQSDNFSILTGNGDATFTSATNYFCGDDPLTADAADFDGDGDIDIAIANLLGLSATVLLNNGDGTFQSPVFHESLGNPHGIIATDLDGDCIIDLVVSNRNPHFATKLSAFKGAGDGTFGSAIYFEAGSDPHGLAVADFDGDGSTDIVVPNVTVDSVSILFNLRPFCQAIFPIFLDIKPRSCPNPLNIKSYPGVRGFNDDEQIGAVGKLNPSIHESQLRDVIPVAILGSADLDVLDIDVSSLTLAGVAPVRSSVSDVVSPVPSKNDECDCDTLGADGFDDLTLKFDKASIVEAIGEVSNGDIIALTLAGQLLDGTLIEGVDCVIIRATGQKDGGPGGVKPNEFVLSAAYPNPFNPSTKFNLVLPEASDWNVVIYNIYGQIVEEYGGFSEAGVVTVEWDATQYASGVYFYKVNAGDFTATRKMTLLK